MVEKYFMHRIQRQNGSFSNKGIEVHDTKESAIRSFWGRMKTGYGADPTIDFVHCEITDANGKVVEPYNLTWNRDEEFENTFFMHHIRMEGETYTKDVDVCSSFDAARASYAAQMEYGYGNPTHPNVTMVSCQITDRTGSVMKPFDETWNKTEAEAAEE